MRYGGKDRDGWHTVTDEGKQYAILMHSAAWSDPLKTGVAILSFRKKGRHSQIDDWTPVLDKELRERIMACAWPMYLEE